MKWMTIEEFATVKPRCLYRKEHAPELQQDQEESLKNVHILIRHNHTYPRFQKASIRISADDYYKLYINGSFICQGPAPAYPEYYYYNEVDITNYLTEGENSIAIHLYYQGLVNRVYCSGDNRCGVAVEVYCDEICVDSCDETWKYKRTDAYTGDIIGYDTQFLENFDSRLFDSQWKERTYNDTDWKYLKQYETAEYVLTKQPTELVEVYRKDPVIVKRQSEPDNKVRILLDFGRELTGAVVLSAIGNRNDEVLIQCGEELEAEHYEIEHQGKEYQETDDCSITGEPLPYVKYEMRCNCRYEETWVLDEGINTLEPFDYKAFRYAQIIIPKHVELVESYAQVRHYPMKEEDCLLESSNQTLLDIFSMCKNAVRCGTQEGYLDCPSREKGQYLGDAFVTAHAQVLLTGKTDMMKKCIVQFAQSSMICKGLMAVVPGNFMQEIADFSLLWPEMVLQYYEFTNDLIFVKDYLPMVKTVLSWFQQYEREDGLLEQVDGKWNLVDWPENLRDDYDFPLTKPIGPGCHCQINAMYIGAWKTYEALAALLGEKIDETSARIQSFIAAFYHEEKQLFVDCEKSLHSSLHANLYPLYYGIVPKEGVQKIVDYIMEKGLCCGVLTSYFVLKGLTRHQYVQEAYELMMNTSEHGWINMLREGATSCFEAWGKEQKWNTSLCHPWASAPIILILEDFLPLVSENGGNFI